MVELGYGGVRLSIYFLSRGPLSTYVVVHWIHFFRCLHVLTLWVELSSMACHTGVTSLSSGSRKLLVLGINFSFLSDLSGDLFFSQGRVKLAALELKTFLSI